MKFNKALIFSLMFFIILLSLGMAAADDDQRVGFQAAAGIDYPRRLFFSCARLPREKDGEGEFIELVRIDVHDFEHIADQGVLRLFEGGILDPVFSGNDRHGTAGEVEDGIIMVREMDPPADAGVEGAVDIFEEFRDLSADHVRKLRDKQGDGFVQLFGFHRGENDFPVLLQDKDLLACIAENVLVETAFGHHSAAGMPEGDGLVQGIGDTLRTGGDQQGVHPQFLRRRIGDHVAENHGIVFFLQPQERIGRLLPAVNGYDIDGILHQFAENARIRRNIREADDCQTFGIAFRHLDGSQNIVDGDAHFDHGKGGSLLQHFRCASAGNKHIVITLYAAQRNLHALLQVADKDGQIDIRALRGELLHDDFHPAVGSDTQNSYFSFLNIRQECSVHSLTSFVLI